jgi:peptide/nickel transport system permease protein
MLAVWPYMARRLLAAIVTIWLVVTLVFLIFFVLPGGTSKKSPGGYSPVVQLFAGRTPGAAIREQIEQDLGLDRPVFEQYRLYMGRLVHGDFGVAYRPRQEIPVWPIVQGSIRPTVELAIGASVIILALGGTLGIASAIYPKKWGVRSAMTVSYLFVALPAFVIANFAIVFLSRSDIYPVGEYVPMHEGLWNWFKALFIPWLVLALPFVPMIARLVRGGMREAETEDYIRAARGKGLPERDVIRHELRASILPVVTLFGLNLGALLGGSVVVETIFEVPGLGSLLTGTAFVGDFPVVAAVTIVASIGVILANLGVDLLYVYIDPRVRLD